MRVPVTYVTMAFRQGEQMDPFSHRYRQVSEHARSRGHEPNRRAPRLDAGRREGRALGRGRDLEVVGESFYQDNLRRLAGARPGEPVRVEITAVLAAEDDNPYDRNAIAVWDGSGSAPLGRGSRDRQPAPHGAPWASPGPTQRLTAVRLKSARRPKKAV